MVFIHTPHTPPTPDRLFTANISCISLSLLFFLCFSHFFFPFCRLHFAISLPLCQRSPNIIALHFCETCFTPSLFGCLPILITLQSLNVYMCPSLLLPCCPSLPPSISSLIFINHFISLLSDPLFLST